MITLTTDQARFLKDQLAYFRATHEGSEVGPIHQAIRYTFLPPSLAAFKGELERLDSALGGAELRSEGFDEEGFASLMKLVLFARRRTVAASVEARKATTNNQEMIRYLDSELAPFDEMLEADWVKDVPARAMPRLTDYLNLEQVERALRDRGVKLEDREFDEKFRILQAPKLLVPDICYYREVSVARGNSVVVAQLDIDDFKALNTIYGHYLVDANVLPIFMRALEGFAFGRGYAYRHGGDEYAVLLANGQGAEFDLQQFQATLASLSYADVAERVSVSIGFCSAGPECYLSDNAVAERANRAMRHAKQHRKGGIATFRQGRYQDEDLIVI